MRTHTHWARFAIASVTLSASIAACDSVLDIQDPKMRPDAAGASGDPSTGATDTGGSSSGSGGTHGINPPMGGAGQAGEPPIGGTDANAGAGGEGGQPVMKECEKAAVQCGGTDGKTPQICDETGHWIVNVDADVDEPSGVCAIGCVEGKCTECENNTVQCKTCADDTDDCSTNQPQTCVGGVWTDLGDPCEQFCLDGGCETAPSCDAAFTARTTCRSHESCCESLLVPGGTFNRYIEDDFETPYPATVSPFYLDKFEVTVGRMRQFVSAFEQLKPLLKDGDGKSTHIADDTGWDTSYVLPADQAALLTQLKCADTTWSDSTGQNNDLPMNCVTYNVAYAFCIWDGGRLPTEAEWELAAIGGDQHRAYPWKAPETGPPITTEYANYDSLAPAPAGTTPKGDARWGQADLSGNVAEWTSDYYAGVYPSNCVDCVNATPSSSRADRGGAYLFDGLTALPSMRDSFEPLGVRPFIGFRCARDLE